ncbi:hypothetical protein EVAR_74671_1 [Eumeta japonica]|uniref:Uncharacterized protein n=1 Tax=Eumeta variegata TaxID=151549 RepID=A0A4C1TMU5_EUMVA|nr:hypothetical protein EVAR_74671_1 [Eumeta japonica]
MPESYDTAMRRLRSMEKKLASAESIYIERLWYLPHFAVTHPQKKSALSLMRPPVLNGKCLNDALLTGPDLIRSLLGVLVRFRQGRVSADIKEMFLRVKIREEDQRQLTIPVAK